MKQHDQLTQLRAQYADSVRQTQSALAELSASVFNRPQLHDCFRSSAPFLRWQSCHERCETLEQSIERLQQEVQCQA